MATFVFYADQEHKRRPDGRNTFGASGADEASAREAAESLIGQPFALQDFRVVELDGASPAFLVEGPGPIGVRDQGTWPTQGRSGDFLPGA